MKTASRCNEQCARATANLIRGLIRLASHLSGWQQVWAFTGIAVGTAVWLGWDWIVDWLRQ
jgi:hypothetical protein